jgi:predicted secreted protein
MTQFPGPDDQQPGQSGSGAPGANQPPYGQSGYGAPPPPPGYGSAPPPAPGYGQLPGGGTPPPNYLVWAILSTLFCCLPLGIASIVFAAQVNSKYTAGDLAGAQDSSDKAKKFAIWSAIAGVVVGVLYVLLVVVGGVLSNS